MTDAKERLKSVVQQLETERDELKLKLGLAKLEARDEWDALEAKMDALRGRMGVIGAEAKEASSDVAAAAEVLAGQLLSVDASRFSGSEPQQGSRKTSYPLR